MQKSIKTAAERLRQAAETGQACAPVRELIGLDDLAAAYEVQALNTQLRLAAGARIVGRKIGLTAKSVQTQLGVEQPDYGVLFHDREVLNGAIVPWQALMQPRAEGEIAFVLGKDLPHPDLISADVISAIDYALASIEIVGSRIENWNIRITDTIADNASASHFVLGHRPVRLEHLDLTGCNMSLLKNGVQVSEGLGAACLGSPINALVWLAKTMARLGEPLRAGEVILTGALGPVVAVTPGDRIDCHIDGLGSASVHFGT